MAKRKKIEKELQKLEAGRAVKSSSADSPSYFSHSPAEYLITIPSLDAWGYGERAVIRLRQDNTPVGSIVFYKEGHAIPDADASDEGYISMHLPFNMFESVVDILRNEKPIRLDFNVPEEMAFFSTDWEPVGEAE
jgi:hypothetical protein